MQELKQLADEIHVELYHIMSKTQKSFNSSLSVVDLTVAIHHVFHAPMDKILWDVGEQVWTFYIRTLQNHIKLTEKKKISKAIDFCISPFFSCIMLFFVN